MLKSCWKTRVHSRQTEATTDSVVIIRRDWVRKASSLWESFPRRSNRRRGAAPGGKVAKRSIAERPPSRACSNIRDAAGYFVWKGHSGMSWKQWLNVGRCLLASSFMNCWRIVTARIRRPMSAVSAWPKPCPSEAPKAGPVTALPCDVHLLPVQAPVFSFPPRA